jgi:hypothetical protein
MAATTLACVGKLAGKERSFFLVQIEDRSEVIMNSLGKHRW